MKPVSEATPKPELDLTRKLDPKAIIDYINDNYETWSKSMHQKLDDETPKARPQDPIFDYNLLEALDSQGAAVEEMFGDLRDPNISLRDIKFPGSSFLKNTEIETLRSRLSQFMARKSTPEGFSLYDTKDEEGLHAGNTDYYYDDDIQDEYDIDEVDDDYDGPREHHIELELKPECDVHGMDGCDCPVYESNEELNDEASYNFTFEYNEEGKLVPAFNDVEEKLRSMALAAHDKQTSSAAKKKKKKKKKQPTGARPTFDPEAVDSCLFCDFEAIYGRPPRQLIKWYNQQIEEEEYRRQEIKKKLQTAKSKALKKQKELRAKQKQERDPSPEQDQIEEIQ